MGLLLVGPCGSGPGQGLVAFGWGGGLLVPYSSIGLLHWGAASFVFTCFTSFWGKVRGCLQGIWSWVFQALGGTVDYPGNMFFSAPVNFDLSDLVSPRLSLQICWSSAVISKDLGLCVLVLALAFVILAFLF